MMLCVSASPSSWSFSPPMRLADMATDQGGDQVRVNPKVADVSHLKRKVADEAAAGVVVGEETMAGEGGGWIGA